jgi:hypothetical protein
MALANIMQPSESFKSSISLSLADAKRGRQQLQKEASTLASRVKLLEKEEQKLWKRIELTHKQTDKTNKAYKLRSIKLKAKADFTLQKSQRLLDAKSMISRMKQDRSQGKMSRLQQMMKSRQNSAHAIKELKSFSDNFKVFLTEAVKCDNIRRSASVKQILASGSQRYKSFQASRVHQARENYSRRIDREEDHKLELRDQLVLMESLETELLARLKDTQQLQISARSDLEKALRRSHQDSFRLAVTITPAS